MNTEEALALATALIEAGANVQIDVRQGEGRQPDSNVPNPPTVQLRISGAPGEPVPAEAIALVNEHPSANIANGDLVVA